MESDVIIKGGIAINVFSVSNDVKYKELIDLAFKYCDEFTLVVRKDIDLNNNAKSVIEKLKSSLKTVKEQSKWPGTSLGMGRTAYVYYYNTDDQVKKIIKEVADSLHSWMQPNLPEDLSFLKNGSEWLINTAHEKDTHIITADKEECEKIKDIEGVRLLQII